MSTITIDSPLYLNAFNYSIWKNNERIDYLKSNILCIEKVVQSLLDGIAKDFPNLTDHSLAHSKMLWNYANIIVGEKLNYINPIEAFILHLSFLIHDAGMCFSILNNKDEIANDLFYKDFLKEHGTSVDTINEAIFYVVRLRHGDFALRIATEKLSNGKYLIEDTSLREELGLIIGKIAQSHTCNVNFIEREFGPSYVTPNFPTSWAIDCQKLSYILRTADAAHIDNLRTPKTYKMIAQISGESKNHWTFQKKLGFPQLSEDNLLMYSTNTPFSIQEQKAWWFCYDALQVLDSELKNANEYFEIKRQDGFAAKGVKAISDSLILGKNYIRTKGWDSINTKVKVTNPVHIASELGGIKLYGNINYAIRELVQNSIDAINLYRIQTGQNNTNVGEIKLCIEKIDNEYYFNIIDNGIGMSQNLLTNELLDFGGSFWKSNRFNFEYSGAKYKGFEAIGKFGIGFFSVFMLGEQVSVTSWKFGESIEKMKTLDFYDGLHSNPILREPTQFEEERIIDRGTSVRIKLLKNPYDEKGFVGNSKYAEPTLFNLVKFFIPSCNVKLTIIEADGSEKSLLPNGMYSLKLQDFVRYNYMQRKDQPKNDLAPVLHEIGLELIELSVQEKIIGKLILLPPFVANNYPLTAIILSKGIRIQGFAGFCGYLITDEIITIKRDAFAKIIPFQNLKEWAIKQIEMIRSKKLIEHYNFSYYSLLMYFGLHDDNLIIGLSKKNGNYSYSSLSNLKSFIKNNKEVKFYSEGHVVSTRPLSCDGFIIGTYKINFESIIIEEDLPKLNSYYNVIENAIKEVWGEFNAIEDNMVGKSNVLELPYSFIKTYTKE